MGWQDDARRTVVSDKKNLTSMEGYWIKVRKWSIKANDEIQQAERDMQKGMDRKALFEAAKRIKSIDSEKLKTMSVDELLPLLSADEFFALTESQNVNSARLMEIKLSYGIDSHNFCDGDVDTRSTDKDIKGFASQIINYPEPATEMLQFVEELLVQMK
ncbi:MAG: hypothetical protein EOM15_17010, partial [Spirochaetia bacterium]|nr:hypothetical protein [Spirochaetia bacterium]